jgi:hypothetical protein
MANMQSTWAIAALQQLFHCCSLTTTILGKLGYRLLLGFLRLQF